MMTDAMYNALRRAGGEEGNLLGGLGYGRWGATRKALHNRGWIDTRDSITANGAKAFADETTARAANPATA